MQQRSSSHSSFEPPADPVPSAPDSLWQTLFVAYDGACAISGCQVGAVLRPVLIDPQGPAEPHNALLLRADLQILFQSGLLTIDAMTLEVLIAPELRDSEYGALAGRRLRQPSRLALRPSRQTLAAHHRFFRLEQPPLSSLAVQRPLLRQMIAVQSWVNSLTFSPNRQVMAIGSWDGAIRLWRLPDYQMFRVISGNIGEINAVDFSPDSQLIAAAGRKHGVRVWRIEDGELLFHLGDEQRHGAFFSVAFQPNGRFVATAGWDPVVYLWDAQNGQPVAELPGHEGLINSVIFSPDSSLLFSAGYDRVIRVWDANSQTLVQTLRGHSDAIFSLTVSPDGRLLASAGSDGAIFVWRVADGQPLQILATPSGACFDVVFSPDGRYLASAHYGRIVRVWHVSDGGLRWELSGHNESVTCVAFTPDGDMLASGSYDSTVRIWSFQ